MKKIATCWRPLSKARRRSSSHSTFATSGMNTEPWGVGAPHPQSFLSEIFRQEESTVMAKLEQQAADRRRTLRQLLDILNATVPDFAVIVSAAISKK